MSRAFASALGILVPSLAGCGLALDFGPPVPSAIDAATDTADAAAPDPADGLVAWYPFDGDPADGKAVDETGNGHHAVCNPGVTCPAPATGIIGDAARFDGMQQYLKVSYHADFDTTSGFTVAAWVRIDGMTGEGQTVIGRPIASTASTNTWIITFWGGLQPNFILGNKDEGENGLDPADVVEIGRWIHLAGTWDGTTMSFYIDGVRIGAQSWTADFEAGDPIFIGVDKNNELATYFQGGIDDVRIYDHSLHEEEIVALYSLGS